MIAKIIDRNTISVTAQDPDDLLVLRRVIRVGDRITGDTTRQLKRDREYSRPDRGERIRIRISMQAERISLDHAVDRLRVSGAILESSNEAVPHGSHHSMLIQASKPFAIHKRDGWGGIEKRLVTTRGDVTSSVLVAIDRSDCGIGRLDGTHLEIMPNIYSGSAGKRYKTNFRIEIFFMEVYRAVSAVTRGGDTVVVFGPGETKKKFANFAAGRPLGVGKGTPCLRVVEGIDTSGEDGIHTFTRSEVMREVMSGSKIAEISTIIDSIMSMASKKGRRFTMGFGETSGASKHGAIESLVFSDRVLEEEDEDSIIRLLNDAESKGARVFSVDSSTDLGLRVAALGGIVSTLRFAVGDQN